MADHELNRYFFAQVGKQGTGSLEYAYNHGGQIADYVIDVTAKRPAPHQRDGQTRCNDLLATYGPKVMVINRAPVPAATRCRAYPQSRPRPARRSAHLGRLGRHRRLSGALGRRQRHGTARRNRRPARPMGSRRPRHPAGHRSPARPKTRARGPRPATSRSQRRASLAQPAPGPDVSSPAPSVSANPQTLPR